MENRDVPFGQYSLFTDGLRYLVPYTTNMEAHTLNPKNANMEAQMSPFCLCRALACQFGARHIVFKFRV